MLQILPLEKFTIPQRRQAWDTESKSCSRPPKKKFEKKYDPKSNKPGQTIVNLCAFSAPTAATASGSKPDSANTYL